MEEVFIFQCHHAQIHELLAPILKLLATHSGTARDGSSTRWCLCLVFGRVTLLGLFASFVPFLTELFDAFRRWSFEEFERHQWWNLGVGCFGPFNTLPSLFVDVDIDW